MRYDGGLEQGLCTISTIIIFTLATIVVLIS